MAIRWKGDVAVSPLIMDWYFYLVAQLIGRRGDMPLHGFILSERSPAQGRELMLLDSSGRASWTISAGPLCLLERYGAPFSGRSCHGTPRSVL
ncbi:hypothetical protein [Labrenzia sp. 5N]|uniref:hypothetical protein n=1 Tax=Labrenzia sp. 5N TaxID=2723402 RepID=UPI0014452241|nr:hypothetical protein [Labrenzia sp. 5N]